MDAAFEWVARHGAAAAGRPADEIAEAATGDGLTSRTTRPGAILTLEFQPDRITIETDAEGRVTQVRAG